MTLKKLDNIANLPSVWTIARCIADINLACIFQRLEQNV